DEAAGLDLFAFLLDRDGRPSKSLIPGHTVKAIPTGIACKPPSGHVGLVCSRSGLAKERCLFVANAPGVVDPDYTGEIQVLLFNGGPGAQYIEHEQRVAQLLVVALPTFTVLVVDEMPYTERGTAGFGSTGR